MKRLRSAVLLCGAAVSALASTQGSAQQMRDAAVPGAQPPSGDAGTQAGSNVAVPPNEAADEIIVTAQRRAQALQDVPMSINVATGQQLQRLKLFDAKDVQNLVPGLQLSNTDGRSNTATLRGVGFNPDQGTSPAVDLYLNDVPIDAQTAFTGLYDIDQVEVLRGPQGALRGRTAPAGAITIRTRRASVDDVSGYLQLTGTEDHAFNAQGGVSLPLVPGTLGLRVAGLADGNRLNQVYNINRDEYSRSRTLSGRISLTWKPSDTLNVFLTYQYLYADNRQFQQVAGPGNAPSGLFGDPRRSGPAATPSDYIAVSEGPYRFENETHFVNLAFDWDLNFATLSGNAAYQKSKLRQFRDGDAANALIGLTQQQLVVSPYPVKTGELRLDSNNNDFWNWSISGFYSRQTGNVRSIQPADVFFFPQSTALRLPISADVMVPVRTRSYSIAASSSFQFTDKLRLEVAARYTDSKSRQAAFVTISSPGFPGVPPSFPAIPPIPANTSAVVPPELALTHVHPLTGGATLTYEFSPDVTAYFAYGRSYRGPTAGVSVPQNITGDLVKSRKETSNSFELGLKTSLLDRRLSVNVAAFYQTFNGFITRIPGVSYDFGARNAFGVPAGPPDGIIDGGFDFNYNGDAKVKGVEATITGRPTDNWDFAVNAAYSHARFSNAPFPCNDYNGDGQPDANGTPRITGSGNVSYCLRNDRLADVPDFSLTANSELRFNWGDMQPFISGLFTYRPSFYSNTADFRYRSREQLNLFVGLRGPNARWEITAFAKNVLNQKRVTNIGLGNAIIATSAGIPFDSGYRLINTTNPREFGGTLSFNF